MPYCSTPPSLCSASNTVTSYPSWPGRQHMPIRGPLPITATLCPLEATAARWLLPCSNSQSPTKRSSLPIATGSPLMPSTHAPSHCASCGQTRPHTEGSEESSAMTAAAPARSPASTLVMKFGTFDGNRTMRHALGLLAVQATRSLKLRFVQVVSVTNFVEVRRPYSGFCFPHRDAGNLVSHTRFFRYIYAGRTRVIPSSLHPAENRRTFSVSVIPGRYGNGGRRPIP